MKPIMIFVFFLLVFLFSPSTSQAKILSKDLVKRAVVEYATKESFCQIADPSVVIKLLTQPLGIDVDPSTPNIGSDISESDCMPDSNIEIIFGHLRLDFLDSLNASPGYEQIFLFDDKILRADSISYEYYDNFDPNAQKHKDVFLGKALGQKSIRSSLLHLTDPSLPGGQQEVSDSGYIMTFNRIGKREKLFFIYEGNAYLSVNTIKEIKEEIVLVDYTSDAPQSPTPEPDSIRADWNIYEGDGFIIKYPPDLKASIYEKTGVSFFGRTGPLDGNCVNIRMVIHNISSSDTIKAFIEENRKRTQSGTSVIIPKEYFPYKNILDNNIAGFWVESGSEAVGKHIFIQQDGKYIEYGIQGCAAGDSYEYHPEVSDILEKMIPTFKFTDSKTIDTSNWKTLTNSLLGYELKYPPTLEIATSEQCSSCTTLYLNREKDEIIFIQSGSLSGLGFEYIINSELSKPNAKKITNDGKVVIEYRGAYTNKMWAFKGTTIFINEKTYPINIEYLGNGTNEKLFDQITSTVKITKTHYSSEGQSCGQNAGSAGNAICEPFLRCEYDTAQAEQDKIGTCVK